MTEKNLYYKEDFLLFKEAFEQSVKSGQFTSALGNIESVIQTYSDHSGVLQLAAMLYFHTKDFKRAKQFIESALQSDPTNFEYRILYSNILHMLNESDEAMDILQELHSEEMNNNDVLVLLAKIEFRRGNYENVIEYAQKVCESDNMHSESWALLGKAYLEHGHSEEQTLEYLQKARQLGLVDDELEFYYAKALFHIKDYEQCKKHCRKFMMKNPNSTFNLTFRELLVQLKNPSAGTGQEFAKQKETVKSHQDEKNKVQKYKAVFSHIESQLNKEVIGQQEYLSNLCLSFMRPLISSNSLYKSAFFITGRHGQGIELSIKLIGTYMHKEKLIKSKNIVFIDLLSYAGTEEEEFLFLSDLYKALYGNSTIIVFRNIEKCPTFIISKLTQLLEGGKVKLNGRYGYENGDLYRVHGRLLENSFDEIKANGQYFLFVSTQPYEKIRSIFPQQALKHIKDQLSVPDLSRPALLEIASRHLIRMKDRIANELSLNICLSEGLASVVVDSADLSKGVHGIIDFIEQDMYSSIAELCLQNKVSLLESYEFFYQSEKLAISNGTQKINLTSAKVEEENVEEVKKEFENIIGLSSVKKLINDIEGLLELQRLRIVRGAKGTRPSLNLIFSGNPGTGKTTVARLLSKYLKAIGFLSSGHLVEVDRGKLVAQYVGQTAPRTQAQIDAAKGGVLFIDEAYSLAQGDSDDFGKEAISTIVKGMEDNRDDVVVILAGYEEEMEEFLKINPGLRSRFNHHVVFEDYSPEELYRIANVIAHLEGYKIEDECKRGLIEFFTRRQIPGKNDTGNGRLARNVVEEAITKQSQRLLSMDNYNEFEDDVLNTLTADDFSLNEQSNFDLEAELEKIIGLNEVKEFIRKLSNQIIADQRRKDAGYQISGGQTLNMIFTGNPGTGKTTVARIFAGFLKEIGILKSGQLVEVDRSELVAEYVGQTALKTRDKFMSALGGVLFIDEAYALSNDQYGKESIDTLVKLMEDHRENVIIILAGYEKEMKEFLKINFGLNSRFPLKIHFADYSIEELHTIGKQIFKGENFVLHREAEQLMKEKIIMETKLTNAESGNGRLVRNLVEEVIRNQSARIALDHTIEGKDMITVIGDDIRLNSEHQFGETLKKATSYDLEAKLTQIIGLKNVKNFLKELQSQIRIQEQREKLGLSVQSIGTLHMVFKGNPGTGKTIIARIVGELLYQLGILRENKVIEVDRSQLVAGYVGQTAIKTQAKIEQALGGVLFIDEAYTLAQDANSDHGFGAEAIAALLKGMEDNRDNLVVILAGYTNEMKKFMEVNSGLSSRFTNEIEFEDYTVEELFQIAEMMYGQNQYELTRNALEKLKHIFETEREKEHFGNGRFVRNIYEDSLRKQAVRLQAIEQLSVEDLKMITEQDING
ncbi:AAA family ATPase [Metabacillus fastidiosus]|uniref:AAA family ATPase n=1 Tax=Metabacillus fastidiosus TaxID=1458 RepID=UPI002DBC6BDF|nr:AAA family ATPase [Metabacillus fastidiosus]MEC2075952.1 AAA family ATPase [Metabacillus fastidiosus]